VEKYGTARQTIDDHTIWRTRIPCWITKATSRHSEYVMLTSPRLQMLRERVSMLRLNGYSLSCQNTVKPAFSGPAKDFSYVTDSFRFIHVLKVYLTF